MKSPQTKVVYTAVFGDYDQVSAVNPKWDCDFICFTDNPDIVSPGWRTVVVSSNGESPSQTNRRYKMQPHKYLPEYECSLYIDGNVRIVSDPVPLFHKYLDQGNIAIPKHQDRNCAYVEAQYCIQGRLVNEKITNRQMAKYASEGFPEEFGMTENGIIFRKHHNSHVIALMTSWWMEYCEGARRDQLSLPYLLWKQKINVLEVVEGPRISGKNFMINLHAADKSKSFLARLARRANGKKHLNYYYLFISRMVFLIVSIRDRLNKT